MCRRWNFFYRVAHLFHKKDAVSIGGAAPVAAMAPAFKSEVSPAPPAPHLIADANKIHPEGIPTLLMKSRGDSSILTVLPVGERISPQRNLSGTWRVRILLDDRLALESNSPSSPASPWPQPKRKKRQSDEGRFQSMAKFSRDSAPRVSLAAAGLPGDAAPLGRANAVTSTRDATVNQAAPATNNGAATTVSTHTAQNANQRSWCDSISAPRD